MNLVDKAAIWVIFVGTFSIQIIYRYFSFFCVIHNYFCYVINDLFILNSVVK
jgi:hypothetical protein